MIDLSKVIAHAESVVKNGSPFPDELEYAQAVVQLGKYRPLLNDALSAIRSAYIGNLTGEDLWARLNCLSIDTDALDAALSPAPKEGE